MAAQSSGESPHRSTSSQTSTSVSGSYSQSPGRVANASNNTDYGADKMIRVLQGTPNGISDGHARVSADASYGGLSVRKRSQRNSGGFLLQHRADNESETLESDEQAQLSEVAKGKRKAADVDLVVPKSRGNPRPQNRRQHSLGSSPLATEVVNAQTEEATSDYETGLSSKPMNNKQRLFTASKNMGIDNTTPTEKDSTEEKRLRAIGRDIDPTQIINLALNLSESRRRNLSSSGNSGSRESIASRRLLSSGQPIIALPYSNNGGSYGHHSQQNRLSARNASPRLANSTGFLDTHSISTHQEKRRISNSFFQPDQGGAAGTEEIFNASDATFARVEKAKHAFELFYEYRRLLQYLPAFSAAPASRPATGRAADKFHYRSGQGLGRTHNPLQYLRNRKIRLRERRPLTAEADGWKHLDKVREWVHTVKSEREDDIMGTDDLLRLPAYNVVQPEIAVIDDLQVSESANPKSSRGEKSERPHHGWTVTPWDLLADAAWLGQGDNFMRIQDASGKRIVENDGGHKDALSRNSKDFTHRPRSSASLSRNPASPERGPVSTNTTSFLGNRDRLPVNSSEPTSPVSHRGRKAKWRKGFVRSRDPSMSDDSNWDDQSKEKSRHRSGKDLLGNSALEKQMMDMLAMEAAENKKAARENTDDGSFWEIAGTPKQPEESKGNGSVVQSRGQRPQTPKKLKTDVPLSRKQEPPSRASLDLTRMGHQRMSSDDFDSTNPNSPITTGFIPSIAINFSPPSSPLMSATSPKRAGISRGSTITRSQNGTHPKQLVSAYDFGTDSPNSAHTSQKVTGNSLRCEQTNDGRPPGSSNGLLSPMKSKVAGGKHRLQETRSLRSFKDSGESESRFRGFFKGGRIAEIMGSQVSRAGEMLWRKEGGNSTSALASPQSSPVSGDSESDDADISAMESSPNDGLSRVTTNADSAGQMTRSSTNPEKPKYYMSNLPSFRSPNKGGDQSPKSPTGSPVLQPVPMQQVTPQERGRSSRFDRLAPPKLDMRGVSPSPSPRKDRDQSQGPGDDTSDGSDVSRSQSRLSSHNRLNGMLGTPGKVGTSSNRPTPTGLSGFQAQLHMDRGRPSLEGKRQWSISDRGVSSVRGAISKRDVARVQALLLSSGVKANEIIRRADEVPDKPSKLLEDLQDVIQGRISRASIAQEHIVGARMLISRIEYFHSQSQAIENRFSNTSIPQLTGEIDTIEDRVTKNLAPLVRDSADDADTFSAELTTTHTLAVKQLHDSIDLILRRRRRKSRWLRRRGWAMLEWAVLGVMWMAWLIVVIIRLIRCVITGCVQGVRWLFWL